MAATLASAVQGGRKPPQLITWEQEDGAIANLTGATLTGKIRDRDTGAVRAIEGALTVIDGEAGQFLWTYAPEDVANAGEFDVQFSAAYDEGPTPAITFLTLWTIQPSL